MRWRLVVIGLAVAAALVPMPAALVERLYARAVFPRLQPILTTVSNVVPFALFDVLLLSLVVLVVWWVVRAAGVARRRGWMMTGVRLVAAAAALASAAFLAFLLVWGFNYRRLPLSSTLDFDRRRVTPDAARRLAADAVMHLNELHAPAHAAGWPPAGAIDAALAASLRDVQQGLGLLPTVVPGRPKRSLLDAYFIRAGVAGMTDPYFLETMIASDILPFERPAVVAHEWAHLAGFAEESEANFIAWLACLRGGPEHRYSGWLALYGEVAGSLTREEWRTISASLGEGPRQDIRAMRERSERHINPRLSAAGWMVYDEYLKANRVESGARSYGEVVTLVLGTRFEDQAHPRLRR
jgi:hypothetical protein